MGLMKGLGPEPLIGDGTLVKMSTIGDYSRIGKDSRVLSSTIGEHCSLEERNLVQTVTVGDMTYTGADTSIMWANVGKYCCISRLVDIGGNQHDYRAASMMPTYRVKTELMGKLSKHHAEELITVGNDVWIGQGVAISRKPGLTIGDGAVIGAGAVVTKSVEPYTIVAGVPAKPIKRRFDEGIIADLLEARWWDWPFEVVVANWDLLSCQVTKEVAKSLLAVARDLKI